jgi:hypothetical protein
VLDPPTHHTNSFNVHKTGGYVHAGGWVSLYPPTHTKKSAKMRVDAFAPRLGERAEQAPALGGEPAVLGRQPCFVRSGVDEPKKGPGAGPRRGARGPRQATVFRKIRGG